MYKPKLLIVTNLFPLPWEPNRAIFNRQHFKHLEEHYNVAVIVTVAWMDYYNYKNQIKETDNICYIPYFYTPKIGRRFYGEFMYRSIIIHASKWIYNFAPDLLMASWAYPEGLAVKKLAKKLNIEYSLKIHGSDVNAHITSKVRGEQIINVANGAKSILSVSNALKEKLIAHGVCRDKIHVVYNGVNKHIFKPADTIRKRNEILFIGNLKQDKGVQELLEGFALISKIHPEVKLNIAGSGAMLQVLIELACKLKIRNRINFLGNVPHKDLPRMMQNALVVCLPSYAEGVPNVLLESICCGTPVVATNVGGIPEIVKESVNGFMCQPKDSLAFSEALNQALRYKWSISDIVGTGEYFDWKKNASKSQAVIGSVDIVTASSAHI